MKMPSVARDLLKWRKWQKSLDRIRNELLKLETSRSTYSNLLTILKKNDKLQKFSGHPFFRWLIRNYCIQLGMGIRRLVDKRSDELNIFTLLLDIENNTQQITIEKYVRSFFPYDTNFSGKNLSTWRRAHYYETAQKAFKEAFSRPRKILLIRDVEKDRKLVQKIAKKTIEVFVDEHWAHLGKKKVQGPTINQAHKCLDALIAIHNKYALLLRKEKLSLPKKILTSYWEELFQIPWIR
ncbi:MAG: hypothetical protein H8D56_16950 [Planctomycetes bacterium]|nr:hypothetical protein [Planctomycetota bacterium]MBL7146827.1 hypothetical protein [Phycisphaerae bacterium]